MLVIQYRKYPQVMTLRAKQMVEKVGGNLLGVVLNNINISQDSYYYYYSGYYYDYYSKHDDSDRNGTNGANGARLPVGELRQLPQSGELDRIGRLVAQALCRRQPRSMRTGARDHGRAPGPLGRAVQSRRVARHQPGPSRIELARHTRQCGRQAEPAFQADDDDVEVGPVITQFGWQYERQFASLEQGPVALNEFILLIGGLDQGTFIPSITWIVGIRTPGNFEFGVGPNATPNGVALAISSGVTFRAGALAIPVNLAIVPGRIGTRASLLTGFNLYR